MKKKPLLFSSHKTSTDDTHGLSAKHRHRKHHLSLWWRKYITKHWLKLSRRTRKILKETLVILTTLFLLTAGVLIFWISSLQLPDLSAFGQVKITNSTKIYDRTGKILLYDVNQDIKHTQVPFDQISPYLKDATVAIEDNNFYNENGIDPKAIARAFLADIFARKFSEGGSTITQQVIKNSFLTDNKTLARKIEEAVLAIKLDRVMDKDSILGVYLNENPYGGNIYGVEEASEEYFGVPASDVTIAEAAYLASLPQSPTYYSPFGQNKAALDTRKNLVLQKMLADSYIDQAQYTEAVNEQVTFNTPDNQGIKAPHFVFFILNYLEQKYGEDAVQNGGLKVITTLNYAMQEQGQNIIQTGATANAKTFNDKDMALVAIDPTTGQILTMVGSPNYFDSSIDGQYNYALALRQPGSSFKPFVYSTAFEEGYTPDTVLFDIPMEFSTECNPDSTPKYPGASCYDPVDFDGLWRGPVNLRDAISESLNVPSIQLLYLAGIQQSIDTAQQMGITTLGNPDQYGLTLVLGGGQVSLLEMTSAYSVFANSGIRNPYTGILEVDDASGNVLEKYTPAPTQALATQTALEMNNVLSDNNARALEFGLNSPLYFPGYDVADKTGTTNNYKDAWVLGYTPDLVVGAWAGNYDDTPMDDQIARYIIVPTWNQFMQYALQQVPNESFTPPTPIDESNMKPVFQGIWKGGQAYYVDKNTQQLATQYTPPADKEEKVVPAVHSILYWVNKSNPQGPPPTDPTQDPQFANWEYAVSKWATTNGYSDQSASSVIPTQTDTEHLPQYDPQISITSPSPNQQYNRNDQINITETYLSKYPIAKADFYLNTSYLGSSDQAPFNFSFIPADTASLQSTNQIQVVFTDTVGNEGSTTENLLINPQSTE